MSLVEIIVYCNYKRKFPAIGDKDFTSTIGIETSGMEESKKEEPPIKIDEDSQPEMKIKPVKIITKTDN